MNRLTTNKILGCTDATQTFVINTKKQDTNRELHIQLVDELTFLDFTNVSAAFLNYKNSSSNTVHSIDVTSAIDKAASSITFTLPEEILSYTGILLCEFVLKDKDAKTFLTTNTFTIKIKDLEVPAYE